MQALPIGIQEFQKLREGNFLYIDKTEFVYKLINSASYYFLSRPRRFGKSLLLNTIKEVFLGNKHLFKGLWIEDKIEWKKYPVIKISFSNIGFNEKGLIKAIIDELTTIAGKHNISLQEKTHGAAFKELIQKMSENGKVVILIDEYDKPIIDYIDNIPKADKNRGILKDFYSVIKDSDNYIRFFFVTGVSKFSKVSIFSDLNNLMDITLDENYATVTGYTQDELERYFPEYIKSVGEKYKGIFNDIMAEIKKWYNGYSWDGKNFVYNPFSMLNFFAMRSFRDFWFSTGTPTFLMKMIQENNYTVFDLENRIVSLNALEKYEITSIALIPLLFQTGYLTIKEIDLREMTFKMDFPNKEVESSFTIYLLASLNDGHIDRADSLLIDMKFSLRENRIEKFIELVNTLFKGISYIIVDQKEKYFHSVFYLIVKLLGFTIETEVMTIDGRIDCVITTERYIYVIEFKAGQDAKSAIEQIKKKEYHKKYLAEGKPVTLIGINFDIEGKKIDDYLIEAV